MNARQIYEHETGRESHSKHGFPHPAYIEWLETICERVHVVAKSDSWDIDELEKAFALFPRTT